MSIKIQKIMLKIILMWLSGLRMFGILIYARQQQQAPVIGKGKCLRLKCADYECVDFMVKLKKHKYSAY